MYIKIDPLVRESINTGLDYRNGGLTFFNGLYLVAPTSHAYVHTHNSMANGLG